MRWAAGSLLMASSCFLVLLISVQVLCGPAAAIGTTGSPNQASAAYDSHDPIVIDGNDAFRSVALAEGWLGNGTATTPYVVTALSITSDSTCLSISNTDFHFVIRDCMMQSGTTQTGNGIYFHNVTSGVVERCIVSLKDAGIYIDESIFCQIYNCTVLDNYDKGIYLVDSTRCNITKNELCCGHFGIYLSLSTDNAVRNNSVSECTDYGILLLGAAHNTVDSNSLSSCGRFGIHVAESSHSRLTGNDVAGSTQAGIQISESDFCTLDCNSLEWNGIFMQGNSLSRYLHTVTDNYVNGRSFGYYCNVSDLVLDGDEYGQVVLVNCNSVNVTGGCFFNASVGVEIAYSSMCRVSDVTAFGNYHCGIYIAQSVGCTVENLSAQWNSVGVLLTDTLGCTIVQSVISHSYSPMWLHESFGVFLSHTQRTTVNCVDVTHSGNYGMYVSVSDNCTIRSNAITVSEQHGLYFFFSSNCTVVNNTIYDNGGYGVSLNDGSEDNEFYMNTLVENEAGTALDDGPQNRWDDGVNTGNHWCGYTGSGVYLVPGLGGAIDHYPMLVLPSVSGPEDYQVEAGVETVSIAWDCVSPNPSHYVIYVDSQQAHVSAWAGGEVTYLLRTPQFGTTNVTLVVNNTCGRAFSDMVLIHATDTTPPTIGSPEDIQCAEGFVSFTISWTVSDFCPDSYSIYLDGIQSESGPWDGSSIVVDVVGLTAGVYNYTLVVTDLGGNQTSDTVLVTVMAFSNQTTVTSATTTALSQELVSLLIGMGVGAGATAVVVIVVLRTRRK